MPPAMCSIGNMASHCVDYAEAMQIVSAYWLHPSAIVKRVFTCRWHLCILQALWVLGSAATLERNPVWAALLANARERGCVIQEANARCICQCLLASFASKQTTQEPI